MPSTTPLHPTTADAAMQQLAETFPSLADARGVAPWDVQRFVDWACGPEPTDAGMHAARFLLQVWNCEVDWFAATDQASLAPFNVVAAMAVWDDDHRGAFRAWAAKPVSF